MFAGGRKSTKKSQRFFPTFGNAIKMTETPEPSIYEEAFVKSDKTDAILVVDGKKLHVNKALLSYHSYFFTALFNSNFKEKSMDEVPIEDVDFEDFATLLSLIHEKPFEINKKNAENLLKLANRFLLENAKLQVERFIIYSSLFNYREKLLLADEYELKDLLEKSLVHYKTKDSFRDLYCNQGIIPKLSKELKSKLFEQLIENGNYVLY
ncbi:unnamed protein product [Caenorhabditis brenneri]